MAFRRNKTRLKQKPAHARMLKRNLLTSLLLYESIRTTKKRAAVIAPEIDKLINFAKRHSAQVAIRHINKTVTDKNASKKIMEVYIKRFAKKDSGLTSVKAAGYRDGDGAPLVDLSLVEGIEVKSDKQPSNKQSSEKDSVAARDPRVDSAEGGEKKKPSTKSKK